MRIDKIYKPSPVTQKRIGIDDIADIMKANEKGLTIHLVEIVGSDRQGVLLTFKETSLKFKCTRTDVFTIANRFNLKDSDEFVGKKVILQIVKTAKGDVVKIK